MSLRRLYQAVFREYQEKHGQAPSTMAEVARWGMKEGLLKERPYDPVKRLAAKPADHPMVNS